jgi:hypothetical protein
MLLSITTEEKTAEQALVILRDHFFLNAQIVDNHDGQATIDINHEEAEDLSLIQILELAVPFAKVAKEA